MDISNQKFEEWRKEQIASLIRMGYPDAANAFRDLGSVQWAGWQASWSASRESLVVDLGSMTNNGYEGFYPANQIKRALRDSGIRTK